MQFWYFLSFLKNTHKHLWKWPQANENKMLKPENTQRRTASQTTVKSRTICEGPFHPECGSLQSYHHLNILGAKREFLPATCQRWILSDKFSTETDMTSVEGTKYGINICSFCNCDDKQHSFNNSTTQHNKQCEMLLCSVVCTWQVSIGGPECSKPGWDVVDR